MFTLLGFDVTHLLRKYSNVGQKQHITMCKGDFVFPEFDL